MINNLVGKDLPKEYSKRYSDSMDVDSESDSDSNVGDNIEILSSYGSNNGRLFPKFDKKVFYNECKAKFFKEVMGFDLKTPQSCHWITFNFDDRKVKDIISSIPDIIKNKILIKRICLRKRYKFSIEQRSEDTGVFRGFHAHLLIEQLKGKAKSHIQREMYSSLKDYLGTKQHIDVRLYKGPQFWQEKTDYLKGTKDDDNKFHKTMVDKLMRNKYQLQEIYESDF